MQKIDDSVVQTVINLLNERNGTLWESYNWELQDEGTNLFVQIYLSDYPSKGDLQTIKNELIKILHPRLPKNQEFWSWSACIYYEGKSIDTVMGGMGDSVI